MNALVTLDETQFSLMMRQAEIIARSGLVPKAIAAPEKVAVVLMTGAELGLPPMTAIRCFDVINNQAALKPQAMIALIERSGQVDNIEITDDGNACTVTMTRKGRAPHTEVFSMDDARRMKTKEWDNGASREIPLAEKSNWKAMPAIMRKWRAIAACARVVFPDVILGLYTTEEIGDVRDITDDGDVIETPKPVIVTPTPAQPPAPAVDYIEDGVIDETVEPPQPPAPPKIDEWWKDNARWDKLVTAAIATDGTGIWPGLNVNHARNRVAKVLGLESWDVRTAFAGCDAKDAWSKCKAYIPSDQQVEPKKCANCGIEDATDNPIDSTLCNTCASRKADAAVSK